MSNLEQACNLADELYVLLRNYADHAADCMYNRTDSPDGDVCVCNFSANMRRAKEIRAKIAQLKAAPSTEGKEKEDAVR